MSQKKPKFIEFDKQKFDIVSVVERHLSTPLKRLTGTELVALCPFHEEKTASFRVNTAKQVYLCDGCGKRGDVVNFIADWHKLDFKNDFPKIVQILTGEDASSTTVEPAVIEKRQQQIATEEARRAKRFQDACTLYANSTPAEHPYLIRKGIGQFYPLFRVHGDCLLIPFRNCGGEITAIQKIYTEPFDLHGRKVDRLFAGSIKDSFFTINDQPVPKNVYVVEGVATGVSIYAGDTNRTVVVAGSANNMPNVANSMAMKHIFANIVLCADNDAGHVGSDGVIRFAGLEAAIKSIKFVNITNSRLNSCFITMPSEVDTDWNDYAAVHGKITDEVLRSHWVRVHR